MSEQSERLTPGADGRHFEDVTRVHERSVRVARRDQLSVDTAQTSGLLRRVAFDSRNPDAEILSAFLTTVLPGAATGAHHHGDQETILYVVEGIARYRGGRPSGARR